MLIVAAERQRVLTQRFRASLSDGAWCATIRNSMLGLSDKPTRRAANKMTTADIIHRLRIRAHEAAADGNHPFDPISLVSVKQFGASALDAETTLTCGPGIDDPSAGLRGGSRDDDPGRNGEHCQRIASILHVQPELPSCSMRQERNDNVIEQFVAHLDKAVAHLAVGVNNPGNRHSSRVPGRAFGSATSQ